MKWIQQTATDGELANELKYYLTESHRIVALGLSKRKRAELGLEDTD
jgi:predicted DNA-binding protein (MmcQ/YjbR family)